MHFFIFAIVSINLLCSITKRNCFHNFIYLSYFGCSINLSGVAIRQFLQTKANYSSVPSVAPECIESNSVSPV